MFPSTSKAQAAIGGFVVLLLGVTAIIGFILLGAPLKFFVNNGLDSVDDGFAKILIIIIPFAILFLILARIFYGVATGGGE